MPSPIRLNISAALLLLCQASAVAEALSLSVQGATRDSKIQSVFLQPGEQLQLNSSVPATLATTAPQLSAAAAGSPRSDWIITAPEQVGRYPLLLTSDDGAMTDAGNKHAIQLQIFVQRPASELQQGLLNGYRIGDYPAEPYKGRDNYRPPESFVEVRQEDADSYITPHIQLKNLLCKQPQGWPKYIVINSVSLMMLERLRDYIKQRGVDFHRFAFISGYRSPWYNQRIGNGRHSRHIYGDAFDLYIDADGDGRFDDINGDGRQDNGDVDHLYRLFSDFQKQSNTIGGLGKYHRTNRHTGFVHIDMRGFSARW